MSRGLAAALALTVLAAGLSGCVQLQDFLDRAQGRTRYADVTLVNEEVPFALSDQPAPPPAQGHVTVLNFTVPAGARTVRVEVTVNFEDTLPLPLPTGVPRGQVKAQVDSPARSEGNHTFTENDAHAISANNPAPGEWGVQLQTFGAGRVFVVATANAPVR